MEEIEVGEYVRTKDGKIGKFVKYSSRSDSSYYKSLFNCFIKLQNRKTCLQCAKDYIVKHSKNIIDLIEVGDYVNGERVIDITGEYMRTNMSCHNLYWLDKNLYSIVTKQQFSSMEYKVEE